jgi:hypothetical protein
VHIVISRHAGDKKISSMPYTLMVTANESRPTNVRMNVEVPVPTSVVQKEGPAQTIMSHRSVGTNIDCTAMTVGDGRYKVGITLSDTSIYFNPKDASGAEAASRVGATVFPSFRTFTSHFAVLLKDGQTTQYTSATDPASGEVMKIDVTLNVVK